MGKPKRKPQKPNKPNRVTESRLRELVGIELQKLAKPGGIPSLELTKQLMENRRAFTALLRKPGEVQKFLEARKIKGEGKVRFRSSKTFPGVTFFIERSGVRGESGRATLVKVPHIGTVAVIIIFGNRRVWATGIHEAAHINTNIIRRRLTKNRKKTESRYVKEQLLSELISMTAAGHLKMDALVAHWGILARFVKALSEEGKISEKEIKQMSEKLDNAFVLKARAIQNALRKTPKGEVLTVLRQSSWENIERDLQERIKLREKFKQTKGEN